MFSHPVCAIDILLWQPKLMQRDNERFVVSLFFFVIVAIVTIIFVYSLLLYMGNQMQSRPYSLIGNFLCQNRYVIDEYTSAFGEILWLVQESQYGLWIKEIDSESNLSGFELELYHLLTNDLGKITLYFCCISVLICKAWIIIHFSHRVVMQLLN